MQISQAGTAQVAGSMSILKSANKQPELALEVFQGALPSGGSVQAAQQVARPVESVEAPDADDGGGRRIDIRV
ncbi:MAG: hypothetical protein L3J49_12905 [Desulfobulbaceae bacterium]|nr:hypothetical protein [Desulfobulbaceae bacterium]